ncbi:MAG: hypothetical protein ACRECW_16065 [Phyllobacterium sp.]
MKLSMRLIANALIRALRWQAIGLREKMREKPEKSDSGVAR